MKAFGRGVGRGAACPQKAPGTHSCRHLCPERLSDHAFWLFESNVAGRQPGCRNRRHGRIHEHHFHDLAADADAPKNAGTRDELAHDCVNRSFAVFKRGVRGAYQVEFGLGLCGRGGYDGSSCGGRRPATGDSRDGDGVGGEVSFANVVRRTGDSSLPRSLKRDARPATAVPDPACLSGRAARPVAHADGLPLQPRFPLRRSDARSVPRRW